jgi:acyl-CoA synthetase (AMP-forming)/AMP-acid ligase II
VAFDVDTLIGRRNDERWNRTAVGDILERLTWSEPEKIALSATPDAVADPRYAAVTYRQANTIANRAANALLARGLARGDRVALLCENSVEAYLTKMAIAKAGLIVVPINVMMAEDMVVHMLRLVEARAAVVDSALWGSGGRPFTAAGLEPVAVIGPPSDEPPGVPNFHDFVSAAPDSEPEVRIHADDIWEILPTSGTTAMPKAVMISHSYSYAAAFSHAMSYTRTLARESDLRLCTLLPVIYHIGHHAYVLSAFLSGGSVVLGRKPTGPDMATTVTREGITTLWGGSPQLLADLARSVEADPDRYDLSSLEVIVYGWNAISPDLTKRLTELCGGRVQFVGIFGQTEAIACHRWWPNRWSDLHERTSPGQNYVGVPTPLLGAAIMDEAGQLIGDGSPEAGEAVYRSPAMFSGYYRDQDATAQALRGGWFHSGDMVRHGEDGLSVMVDRYKDVIKSGGENVSSLRVEAVLAQYPGVARAATVGVPDRRWGEAVTAVVVPQDGVTIDPAELIAFCRARLAGYETPKRVVLVDELPVTVGGKVLKYQLRERLTTGDLR